MKRSGFLAFLIGLITAPFIKGKSKPLTSAIVNGSYIFTDGLKDSPKGPVIKVYSEGNNHLYYDTEVQDGEYGVDDKWQINILLYDTTRKD